MAKPDNRLDHSASRKPGLLYYNGGFVADNALKIPHDDRGYLYGDGLFETIRAYRGKLFRAREHAARMLASAGELGIALELDPGELADIFQETCARNAEFMPGGLYLRATLTRGCGYGPDLTQSYSPNLLVYVKPLPEPEADLYQKGIAAVFASATRAAEPALQRHKTTSYLEALLARREALAKGVAEALILDSGGRVLEGACSNIFMVKDKILSTPPATMNLLPGITRAVVLELAGRLGIQAVEAAFPADKLLGADEAFLTNSIQEILPLVGVEGKKIGRGGPGVITTALLAAYREEVEGASV